MNRPGSGERRIDRARALHLLEEAPLGSLMAAAHAARMVRHPERRVTFVHDTNPNTTNVCVTGCRFCAFHRKQEDPEAYTLTAEELASRVRAAADAGATTVLLQGGHHPEQSLDDWIAYVRAIRRICPEIHIHPFSPPEIVYMARKEKVSTREVLEALRAEEVDTLPGGGAEILSDRTRSILSPRKCSAGEWLEVMEESHGLGFRTTATLMYGHVETADEIVTHLMRLRRLQDRTGGFRSFIPWSFKPGRTPLGEEVPATAHPGRYVRIIAVARLVLDNFPHVQSSWFSENTTAGQLGLLAGADDFGGVLVEENVLRETGFERSSTLDNVLSLIRGAGFVPARRDSHYRVVETYPEAGGNVEASRS